MPLVITWPTPDSTFGPGSLFAIQQTDIGPIPTDDIIEVQLRTEAEFIRWGWMSRQAGGVTGWGGNWVLPAQGFVNQGWTIQLEQKQNAVEGEALRLYAEQRHVTGGVVGTISMPIKFSPTVTAWAADTRPQGTVTFPPSIDEKLDRILEAVYRTWGSG